MKTLLTLLLMGILMACSSKDPQAEINTLITEGKIPQANLKYQELVAAEQDPNLERQYLKFCFENELYRDFARGSQDFLTRYPDDIAVKNLSFDYYALLTRDAEKRGDYQTALDYVVKKLLNADYADHAKWEKRQSHIMTKWYESAKEKNDENGKRKALTSMKLLGFSNLAQSLDADLFKSLEDQTQ